jgi:C1A family cysteine protease
VAAVGPVAFAMNGAQESFLYYRFEFEVSMAFSYDIWSFDSTGIYNDPACRPGVGHSALIYGFGTAKLKNGTFVDFWLCKNSWSVDWGSSGFFRMIRGRNMCGLTSYLIYPLVL